MSRRQLSTIVAIFSVLSGCNARYLVLPSNPHYLLRSPDGRTRFFPDTTADFSDAFGGWVDLSTGMSLQLARAYFEPPESRRIQDYVGLERLQFQIDSKSGALRQLEYRPLSTRPSGQPSVASAIPTTQLVLRHHRLFFQVVLSTDSGPARAVLLSGDSSQSIATFGEGLMRRTGAGCTGAEQLEVRCTPIPDLTTASVLFDVVANDKPLTVTWGSTIAGVVGAARPVKLWRNYRHRPTPVKLDANDSNALRLPLLPGDVLTFGKMSQR